MFSFSLLLVCKLRNVWAVAGQIVGVIVLDERVNQESANLLSVDSSSGSSARSMAEVEGVPSGAIIAQVILVRLTLAWLTGIILLIATILGVSSLILSSINELSSRLFCQCRVESYHRLY